MKNPAFCLIVMAVLFSQNISGQNTTSGTVFIAEHIIIQFPFQPTTESEPYEGYYLDYKKERYSVNKITEVNNDSTITFSILTDSLSRVFSNCSAKLFYANKTMNNDSMLFFDVIISNSVNGDKGKTQSISYLRFFEYDNNLICLKYSTKSSKANKNVFIKNNFFKTLVYKPQLKTHAKGVKTALVLNFAKSLACPVP